VLECVVNVSEGRDAAVIGALAEAAGPSLLDVHSDPHHHRSVLTLAGDAVEADARSLANEAVARLDLHRHAGVHPRLGVVDVVPFVPLAGSSMADALAARDRFAVWIGSDLGVPAFVYGPERSLPEVRRTAFAPEGLVPDAGPAVPHPSAGAVCVGAREVLVAYNVWLADGVRVDRARQVAKAVRGPAVRALGFEVGGRAQVSMNLVDPLAVGPAAAYDAVAALVDVAGAELVGLLPTEVLDRVPAARWADLDLDASKTIEARLRRRQA
jgi:glutamate formiminotransferase / 5-formyltetrahydrofolate cyclo-ligase